MSARGRPFEPGNEFGRGRPRGSRNRSTVALQRLLLKDADEVLAALTRHAKKGDMKAMQLWLERAIPPAQHPPAPVAQKRGTEHLAQRIQEARKRLAVFREAEQNDQQQLQATQQGEMAPGTHPNGSGRAGLLKALQAIYVDSPASGSEDCQN